MKTYYFWLMGLFLLIAGCEREKTSDPGIGPISSSKCKSHGVKAGMDHASDQDCIQYNWLTGDTLVITHVNAAFNCCPEGIVADIKVAGDTLTIIEKENSSLCDCNCLYDLNFSLSGIGKETWWIRVREPYVQQTPSEQILFKIELRKNQSGEFCLTRNGYPWGV